MCILSFYPYLFKSQFLSQLMGDCIFCKIASGEISADRLYENDNFFSIPDANPIINGHTLIISKKHFNNSLDLPNSIAPELFDCIKKTALKLMEENKAGGFNLGNNNFEAAGQLVNHFHLHILPRKKDDGFKFGV